MIFRRASIREFSGTASAVFVALFAILITTQLVRLLGQAAGGRIASEGVLALLGFGAVNYLPVVLSLTLFISILLTLSRSYRDSEMVVWFSSGLPLTAWVRPVMRFALPLVFVIALLAMFLTPWAQSKSREFRQRMSDRDDVAQVQAGVFRESSRADRVFFVESGVGDEEHVRNVFVSSSQNGRQGVMVAREGRTETAANGDRFVVLQNGRRYEGVPGQAAYRVMEFDRYAVRIEAHEQQRVDDSPRALPLATLWRDPTPKNLGELLWRVGMPLAALNLALLAIPLSFVNPRAGRSSNLLLALLTYLFYSNMISLSQAWVVQGKVQFGVAVWAVHVGMFVLLLLLFYRRISVNSWLRWGR